ncbi:MAG: electron transport complex subunit RsxG, partial [Leucothrix sp.]
IASNSIRRAGITLGLFALCGVVLLSSVQWLTKDSIAQNTRQRHLQRLHAIIPPNAYDNDLLGSAQQQGINHPTLDSQVIIYTGQLNGLAVAKVFEVTSLEGYSGAIRLLVGVNIADNSLLGVRVTAHKETPGLGDKIETNKSDWMLQFAGKSLNNPSFEQWRVKKEGGAFDQFTGATITPRAVVNAVREVLRLNTTQGGHS